MAHEIHIPKLSMTMAEAKLIEWKAKDGEWVNEKDVLLVIETDKVTTEIEAPRSGFLIILAEQDSVVPVGESAGMLAETREEYEKMRGAHPAPDERPEIEEGPAVDVEIKKLPKAGEKIKASPLARKMAQELGIDIRTIHGSGPGGRIVKEDIEGALKEKKQEPGPPEESYEGKKVKAAIPLRGMRKAIAEHMHRSLSVSAQLTNSGNIDMTAMIRLRTRLLEREKALGARVTYTDLFVFVLARALKDHPIINSSLIDHEIRIWEDINIGVAVALELGEYESGLVVPVVKNADKKSLIEISRTTRALIEKARSGKLTPDDVSGGTFTISNHGIFDVGDSWTLPIINQPQSAILGTGGINEKPVVIEGRIEIRPMMTFTLTYDHRVIDGAPSFKFMATFKGLMESPDLLLG
ncbi:MAG: dihydrolipoamide acetyltransferase family protein, partial [Pseudomonadota bacterium]